MWPYRLDMIARPELKLRAKEQKPVADRLSGLEKGITFVLEEPGPAGRIQPPEGLGSL